MATVQCGAVVFSHERVVSGVLATVEHRVVEGASVILLASCHSDLATPLTEGMKSAFGKVDPGDERAAARIVGAAPAPLAAGAAALVLAGEQVTVAAAGTGRVYRQRDDVLDELPAGRHAVREGDAFAVSSHELSTTGVDFFGALPPVEVGAAGFRNDTLDDVLTQALGRTPGLRGSIAVAALAAR